ncbi:hypothetical protein FSP39_019388 [Pinctada imbricata]|uniref:GRIP domain-containing protein n=1 Tax=Pinctada imbricata TaxID=66713 RepID=A0AA88Y6C4_PINIB|nr:hypothetical protein FSP39_019388 [Pinctada imbricata]
MYSTCTSCIRLKTGVTNSFPVRVGVRQGDNLSPSLFKIFINDLPTYLQSTPDPIKLDEKDVHCLMFADDIVLFSKSEVGLQEKLNKLHEYYLLYDEDNQCTMCKKLKEELEVAKEEFERYKLRAQSVLKNKATKDSGPNKEMESLKSQVADLREKIKTFHVQHEEAIQRANQRADSASKTVISLQEKHKQDLLHHQAEHQHQVSQLEIEIKKQRERTVSLLSEKDREIEVLRASTPVFDGGYLAHIRNPPDAAASEEMQAKSEEEQAVHRLLKMGQGEANLLYFSQEQARKEVEINVLRKQKHELESALRDLQLTSFSKEEALQEQVENMREEVRKVERNIAREGANLEYLKNVTFKFLTSVDPRAKQQMLNAITTILQFSPQEKSVVHTQLKSWWTSTV